MAEADNTIFVGKKPNMSYVLAVVTQFSDGQKEVKIKARGRSISKAVDVAQIVKNKFVKDVNVDSLQIGTDTVKTEDGKELNVSTIEILLKK
ncbi:MAG: DNA-binding protein Alba [Candidatus Aenigmarchaeota archaeon]|nr:DNA-binding protein Alba [Candidatus Aenigmarchaeota archaeon]